METSDGFTPIIAIFYAVFHPTEGTKIVNQVPKDSINTTANSLFNFNTIKNYIIPKPHLCNKLISIKVGKYKVIGYPVNIQNDNYTRNFFNFNFCFVFPYNSETISYELTIKRMGKMFKVLEEQNYLLSNLSARLFIKSENIKQINLINEIPGFKNFKKINLSSIDSLISQLYQDLNNYSECCIPLDSANSIDIKLFPIYPAPLNLKAYQVPISMVNLNLLVDVNWDPTMIKILPYINGINSIKKISELSDSDYLLTKQCIQHLMHYKCLQIIDIFQFSNIYAPTNNIVNFLKVPNLSERCQSYIVNYDMSSNNRGNSTNGSGSGTVNTTAPTTANATGPNTGNNTFTGVNARVGSNITGTGGIGGSISISPVHLKELGRTIKVPSKTLLFYLYRSLNQGQTVKQWYLQHKKHLKFIDIRRFINFGILNGLIYRVHSYPILNLVTKSIENNNDEINELIENFRTKLTSTNVNSINLKDINSNIYLKSIVNESNLKTNNRRISFNYQNQQFDGIIESDEDSMNDGIRSINNETAVDDSPEDAQSIVPRIRNHEINRLPNISNDEFVDLLKLIKLLKGFQNIDSICTELQRSRTEIESMLDTLGSNGYINS
ncbi:Nitrogen permease regulator 2 [Yamadazyma tenuis]|uniref:NPR2-domain-containing protein n=1 Tax=Candida tenuis (strain ATCC 10573 / BCRC 21748 / CBS 615 / JCM 9827 / NBRC 10315 / NRRL Y-1498 / VKM Y-70) TaxID=590646 RepID=G3B9T9_CANTC|nr:uncharacterized protein CANTEDRAFT_131421 [Yamadazyma tenuis ATCC 10573]EGV61968.1 hypothetical protein CANTEDRAFT_131421 [Yamadazyma tenuis ATCC 10573]WEJ93216.1 Nitrogen permease regulator 2 [Yamadazyma tenuis]